MLSDTIGLGQLEQFDISVWDFYGNKGNSRLPQSIATSAKGQPIFMLVVYVSVHEFVNVSRIVYLLLVVCNGGLVLCA